MKLTEISTQPHLAPRAGEKTSRFDSKYQLTGFLQGQHGVTKKTAANGKTYFMNKKGHVCGIWDGMTNSGVVYHKGEKSET